MTDTNLINPTVADVIRALSEMPQGAPFRILDPDTSYTIRAFRVGLQDDGKVWVRAHYSDMEPAKYRGDLQDYVQILPPEDERDE